MLLFEHSEYPHLFSFKVHRLISEGECMGRSSNQELIKSDCGNYVLYKREGSGTSKYYARVRVPVTNEWKKYSTQTDDLLKAKRFAEKKLAEIQFRQEHNIPLDEKRFADVADAAIEEMTKL